jgi:chromosome segregation ATPase
MTPEDRLTSLESFKALSIRKMNSYDLFQVAIDAQNRSISVLVNAGNDTGKALQYHANKLDVLNQNIEQHGKMLENSTIELKGNIGTLTSNQSRIWDKSDSHSDELQSQKVFIKNVNSALGATQSTQLIHDDRLRLLTAELVKYKAEILSMKASLDLYASAHKENLENAKNDLKDRWVSDFNTFAKKLNEHADISVLHRDKINELKDQIEYMRNSFGDKIDKLSIPAPVITQTTSITNEVAGQIEGISLDAKNAVLKSNNTEMQLKLIDKKLENVLLLLKKHELSQG